MMRRWAFLLTLLIIISSSLGAALPVHAQSDCPVDLSAAAADLFRAQAAGAAGDFDQALASLNAARTALAAILADCRAAGFEPGIPLDNTFRAATNALIVDYPENWVLGNFTPNASGGALEMGTSQRAISSLRQPQPQFRAGDQGIVVVLGAPEALVSPRLTEWSSAPTLEEVLTRFAEIALANYDQRGALAIESDLATIDFSASQLQGVLIARELVAGELYAITVGLAAEDELEALRPIAYAVARSVRQ
ncbi:MAG: hypothetical protein SNJ59_15315 [Aggregatilineales bacterium]